MKQKPLTSRERRRIDALVRTHSATSLANLVIVAERHIEGLKVSGRQSLRAAKASRGPVCELTAAEADVAAGVLEGAANGYEGPNARRVERAAEKLRAFSLALDVRRLRDSR